MSVTELILCLLFCNECEALDCEVEDCLRLDAGLSGAGASLLSVTCVGGGEDNGSAGILESGVACDAGLRLVRFANVAACMLQIFFFSGLDGGGKGVPGGGSGWPLPMGCAGEPSGDSTRGCVGGFTGVPFKKSCISWSEVCAAVGDGCAREKRPPDSGDVDPSGFWRAASHFFATAVAEFRDWLKLCRFSEPKALRGRDSEELCFDRGCGVLVADSEAPVPFDDKLAIVAEGVTGGGPKSSLWI